MKMERLEKRSAPTGATMGFREMKWGVGMAVKSMLVAVCLMATGAVYADYLKVENGTKYRCSADRVCSPLYVDSAGRFYYRTPNGGAFFTSAEVAREILAQPDYQGNVAEHKRLARNYYAQVSRPPAPAPAPARPAPSSSTPPAPVYTSAQPRSSPGISSYKPISPTDPNHPFNRNPQGVATPFGFYGPNGKRFIQEENRYRQQYALVDSGRWSMAISKRGEAELRPAYIRSLANGTASQVGPGVDIRALGFHPGPVLGELSGAIAFCPVTFVEDVRVSDPPKGYGQVEQVCGTRGAELLVKSVALPEAIRHNLQEREWYKQGYLAILGGLIRTKTPVEFTVKSGNLQKALPLSQFFPGRLDVDNFSFDGELGPDGPFKAKTLELNVSWHRNGGMHHGRLIVKIGDSPDEICVIGAVATDIPYPLLREVSGEPLPGWETLTKKQREIKIHYGHFANLEKKRLLEKARNNEVSCRSIRPEDITNSLIGHPPGAIEAIRAKFQGGKAPYQRPTPSRHGRGTH